MRVFISYSGEKGKILASQLLALFNKEKIHDAWTYDSPNYTFGDIAWIEIYHEIQSRDCMVVITDESTQNNINQENEYNVALRNGLYTFAFVKIGVNIPAQLRNRNVGWFDENKYDEACYRLIRDLGRLQKNEIEQKNENIDRIIVDSKAPNLLAIPNALKDLGSLDIEITNKLSKTEVSIEILKSIQDQLRKDWQIRPSEILDSPSEQMIKRAVNQTVERIGVAYNYVNEQTMLFLMHIAGVLDNYKVGITELRERDSRYTLVNLLKARVATQELRNSIRIFDWYSLGMNSILLFLSYFPPQSVSSVILAFKKTPTELRAEREQTLSFLLTNVSELVERELYRK